MSNEKTFTKLPFGETLKRTFAYVWNNKKIMLAILPILLALIVVQIILTLTSSCDPKLEDCSNTWQNIAVSIAFVVLNIGIIINYCRHIVLKEELNFTSLSFWKSTVLYFLASIVLGIFLAIPVIFLAIFLAVVTSSFASAEFIAVLMYAIILIECILFTPLFLIFPCIAVKDYEMLSIKKLFRLVKDNHNRVFWGMLVASLPCFLFLVIIGLVAFAIYGTETVRDSLSFWLLGVVVQAINTCIRGSYYAHIYQFFKFIEKREKI